MAQQPMKGLISELEQQRKLKPVVNAPTHKPKPIALKQSPSSAQHPQATASTAPSSIGVKPSTTTPKEANANGTPKWPPVKTTPTVTPGKPKPSDTTSAIRSTGTTSPPVVDPASLKAAVLRPTTVSASTESQSSSTPSPRQQPAGRGAGRGSTALARPTPGLKPGAARKPSSTEESLSPETQSQPPSAAENGTNAPPWAGLVKKRNTIRINNDDVDTSKDNENINKTTPAATVAPANRFPPSTTTKSGKDQESSHLKDSVPQSSVQNVPEPSGNDSSSNNDVTCVDQKLRSNGDFAVGLTESNNFVTAGSKSYRLVSLPETSGAVPPRKPAKPPSLDLSAYRSHAADDVIDDELYDDVQGDIMRKETRPMSTVSRISEFTEEDETGAAKQRRLHERQSVNDDDEIYDDVRDNYQDGEIYQELD